MRVFPYEESNDVTIKMCKKLNINEALNRGIEAHKAGNIKEADRYYTSILNTWPKHPDANHNMGVLAITVGKLEQSLPFFKIAIETSPNIAQYWLSYVNALLKLERQEEALKVITQAKEIGLSDIRFEKIKQEINSNMESQEPPQELLDNLKDLLNKQKFQVVVTQAYKSLELFPKSAEIYNIIGISYQFLNQIDEATNCFEKAIKINPNFSKPFNNLANILKEKQEFEAAIDQYKKALSLKPDDAEIKSNLIEVLKIHSPVNFSDNSLTNLDSYIKTESPVLKNFEDDHQLASSILHILKKINLIDINLTTKLSQIYKRNQIDLNCYRHRTIFEKENIIPEFCYGCFKLQVDAKNLLDLIRLTSIFYSTEFTHDLTRKCFIELRPEIPGSFKGLIYCGSLDQAAKVKKHLDLRLKDIDKSLSSKIKRGCSEFPIAFPEYGKIDSNTDNMMGYPSEWQSLENKFDKNHPILPKKNIPSSLNQFCLGDYLIIQKWIDYAKGAKDPVSELFCDLPIRYLETFQCAQNRTART